MTDALFDFSIKDNTGGVFYTEIGVDSDHCFGNVICKYHHYGFKYYDTFFREFPGYENCINYIYLYTDTIQGEIPGLKFTLPVQSVQKITNIIITPDKQESSTFCYNTEIHWHKGYPYITSTYYTNESLKPKKKRNDY